MKNLSQKCVKSDVKSQVVCNYHLGERHLRTAVSPWATRLLIGIIRKSSAITAETKISYFSLYDYWRFPEVVSVSEKNMFL